MSQNSKKVLAVEDDPLLKKMLCDALRQEGFKVLEANDGKKGIELALKDKPDFILVDILMPVMDGITMLKELYDKGIKDIPVIILSNLVDKEKMREVEFMGENNVTFLLKTDHSIKQIMEKVHQRMN